MLSPDTILQNRYRIVRQLGQGGMGTVYEALDQRLNSIVAIKETRVITEEARRAFEREASLLANLSHRALPSVIDHFAENDSQYLVMKFIPGDDLAQLLETRGRPFPVTDVLNWGDDVLNALEYLHGHTPPILHRDIKPSNLKLTREGEVVLLDFGLAKGAAGQMPTLLTSRSVQGYTPVYAALEQIHGGGTDPRSDLYSVAATLYHLMTGVAPVDAPARFVAMDDERTDPLRAADEVNPEIPHAVAAVLKSAMAMNRRHRPANAKEMRRSLAEAVAPTSESRSVATEAAASGAVPAPTQPAIEHSSSTDKPSAPVTSTIPTPPPQVPLPGKSAQKFEEDQSRHKRSTMIIVSVAAVIVLLGIVAAIASRGALSWLRGSNAGVDVPATNGSQIGASPQPDAKPTVASPTSTPTPEFVKVRLRLIGEGASGCSVMSGEKVTLQTKSSTFTATTNKNGYASFADVPCGDIARISAPTIALQMKPGQSLSITRNLPCSGTEIFLGSYGDMRGTLLSERVANSCFKPY